MARGARRRLEMFVMSSVATRLRVTDAFTGSSMAGVGAGDGGRTGGNHFYDKN